VLLNRPRATQWMDRCGLDAIIVTGAVNLQYVSGYRCWLNPVWKRYMNNPGDLSAPLPYFAVLPARGEPALVIDEMFEVNAANIWIEDRFVIAETADDDDQARNSTTAPAASSDWFTPSFRRFPSYMDALGEALRARDLGDGRIGIEGEAVALKDQAALCQALPSAKFRDCSNLVRLIRMVKTEEELSRARRAAEIAEAALLKTVSLAKPGGQVQELVQRFRESVGAAGAELDHFAFSPQGLGIATEVNYELSADEIAFIDFGCIYRQYYSDAGTTLMVGRPEPSDQRLFDLLVECLRRAADAMQPGASSAEVQGVMAEVMEKGGITGELPHGHGLGLELREYPILMPENDLRIRDDCVDLPTVLPLEEGMLLNLEASIYGLNDKVFHLEQSYVVTDCGCEPLTDRDLTLPLLVE